MFIKLYNFIVKKHFKAQFFSADNPEAALELLNTIIPSLIILDMEMPVMDGYTFLTIMRDNERLKDIPVIACSSLTNKDLIVGLNELKIIDFIVKTENKDIYIQRIGKALQKIHDKKELHLKF